MVPSTTISDLVTQINGHHREAQAALNSGVEHALEAGRLLLEAKAAMRHGDWEAWIAAHCRFSERTARGYMRIATHWPELQSKRQRAADLSAREALRLLSRPAVDKDQAPQERLLVSIPAMRKGHIPLGTAVPELRPDTVWVASGWDDDLIEIWPVADVPGYYRILHFVELHTDHTNVEHDRRGVRYTADLLEATLLMLHHFDRSSDWYAMPFDGVEPAFLPFPGVLAASRPLILPEAEAAVIPQG
jgi:hypothetical protein